MTDSAVSAAHFQLFAVDGRSGVRWRLLSGNNRELGRAATSHPDSETCLLEIKTLIVRLEDLMPHVRRREGNVWHWALLDGRIPMAVGARSYDRQVRCEQAIVLFRAMAPTARTGDGVTLSGARRWVHPAAGRQPLQLGAEVQREARGRRTPPSRSKG